MKPGVEGGNKYIKLKEKMTRLNGTAFQNIGDLAKNKK